MRQLKQSAILSILLCMVSLLSCSSKQKASSPQLPSSAQEESLPDNPDLSISLGHADDVNCLAFSRDGRLLASGGSDNQVKIWRVSDGRLVRNFQGNSLDNFQTVAFNGAGTLVAAGSSDGTIKIWSVRDGSLIREYQAHERSVRCLAFLPNTGQIMSSSGDLWDATGALYQTDHSIRFWKVSRKKFFNSITPHKATVSAMVFSSKGDFLATGSVDKSVKIWSFPRIKLVRTLEEHPNGITSLDFSPDGSLLATGSFDQKIRLYRMSDGSLMKSRAGHRFKVTSVFFSWDGRILGTTGGGGAIKFWRVPDLEPIKTVKNPGGQVRAIALSPTASLFASAGKDKTVRMYRLVDFKILWSREGYQRNTAKAVSVSPDGKLLASGSSKQIHLWQMPDLKKLGALKGLGSPKQILFSGDGEYMAVITGYSRLKLVRLDTGVIAWESSGDTIKPALAAFRPDGEIIALGTDKTITLYRTTDGKVTNKLKGFTGGGTALAFSPDGNYLANGADQAVQLWRISDSVLVKVLRGHRSKISSLGFSPDGSLLASGSYDQTTKIWKVADGSAVKTLKGHKSPVDVVAFGPDGNILVSLGKGDVVQLWRVQDFAKIKAISDYQYVSSLAFSPEGFMVLGGDEGLRLWAVGEKPEDVYLAADLIPLPEGETIAYTPDGYYSASHEGNVFVGWVFGDQVFGFEQFARLFHRSDIVRARLLGNKKIGLPTPVISPPPRVEMVDHMDLKKTSSQSYPLTFNVRDEFKIKEVRVYVNGVPTVEVPVDGSLREISLDVPLLPGGNRITAIAFNNKGFSSIPRYVDVECQLSHISKPNMYVLSVGVSRYPLLPDELQLSFAHTDAYHVAQVFKSQEGKHYHTVKTTLLTNNNVTANRIMEELGRLIAVNRNDVVVVYLGGHGLRTEDGKFYFMTPASSLSRPARGSINWELLSQSLTKIRGRVILLLDACHSGSIVSEYLPPNEDLAHTLSMDKRSGIMVFCASKGRQQSLESPDIGGGYGVFTYSIVKALLETPEEVDRDRSGYVEFYELVDFVTHEVKNLTESYQIPWLARKEIFGDFPLAMAER